MNSAADIWSKVLVLMEADMTSTTIKTWFDDTVAVDFLEDTLVLHTPSDFKREIVKSRYVGFIQKALKELFSADFKIEVLDEVEMRQRSSASQPKETFMPGTDEYTFSRFVVGSSNKFAHAAAQAVANQPGVMYNPLLIYGESGLGKTHLLHSIAHTIHMSNPDAKIVYIKGDSFTNELIQAIRQGRNEEFRAKYRSADVFLMDDVQFIAGKDSTMEEMFHTFNTLYDHQKQIVFTSDRPPKEMLKLEDRLKTRFESGVIADVQPPDYETRVAIIKNKAVRLGLELPDAVLGYIADNITANVRQIEGTVKKIMALRDLEGKEVDSDTVFRAVKDMFKDPTGIMPAADVIIEEVCQFYNIELTAIRGQSRTKDTAMARQIAMYMIREMTNLSLKEIGKEFENRDHTTVMHSISRVEDAKQTNPQINEIIKDIRSNINGRY